MRISDWSSDVCSSDLGARHIRALPRRASRSTALFKLPCHHAMQNISARFQSKYRVIQLDIAATLGVEGLNLDLHSLALLPFCSFRRHSRFSRDIHGSLIAIRSEEHTSELQSLMRISYAVFCLKKKI